MFAKVFIFAMTARPLNTRYTEGLIIRYTEGLIRCELLWVLECMKSVGRMCRSGHDAPGKQTFASLDNAVKLKGVKFLI